MKYILELVLTTVIVFFIWNFLQRVLMSPRRNVSQNQAQSGNSTNQRKKTGKGLNWDAEDAEYEEIKEEEKINAGKK